MGILEIPAAIQPGMTFLGLCLAQDDERRDNDDDMVHLVQRWSPRKDLATAFSNQLEQHDFGALIGKVAIKKEF
jgi:hypothetical protein